MIVILFLGCANNAEKENKGRTKGNQVLQLKTSETITLKLPPKGFYYSTYVMPFYDSARRITFLYRLNHRTNSIEKYNLKTNQLAGVLKFNYVGPNGINQLKAYYIISDSTLLLMNTYLGKIFLAKPNGTILKRYDYLNQLNLIPADFFSRTENPLVYSSKTNILNVNLSPLKNSVTDKSYYSIPISAKLFFNTNTIKVNKIRYPELYKENNYGGVIALHFFASTYNSHKDLMAYSFNADPVIYTEDSRGKIKKYDAHSRYFVKPKPMPNKQMSFEESRMLYLQKPRYESLMYDKYRNIYYRVCLLPIEIEKGKKYSPLKIAEMPFSIMVLDSNFRVINEQKFKKHLYNVFEYFITEKGLWISANNPYNPGFDENKISYVLFRLNKKKE